MDKQPLATYNPNDPNSTVDTPGAPAGAAPTWCPSQVGQQACNTVTPFDVALPGSGLVYQKIYMGNVSTVGQAKTPSPWGAYDMGGNVVEHTDSLAPQPPGYNFVRDWRYTTAVWRMRRRIRWRSMDSATSREIRKLEGSIPGWVSASVSSEISGR